jgi:predicted aspartyl protease
MIAAASPSSLKFRLAGGAQPLLLLPVSINGEAAREFILDTGAGTTLLSKEFARELNVEITGHKNGHTAGGRVAVQLGRVKSIAVGLASKENVKVGVTDLSHLSRAVGAQIDGDLGYNFLGDFRVTLDFRGHAVRIDEPNRIDYFGPPPVAEIPIRLAHPSKPLILLQAFANDRGPFSFAFDTGTSTTAISSELASGLNLKSTPVSPVTTGSSAIEVRAARLSSLRAGQAYQNNLEVIVGEFLTMLSRVIGSKLDGIIGYNFLRHYKVVIDYPGAVLSLLHP